MKKCSKSWVREDTLRKLEIGSHGFKERGTKKWIGPWQRQECKLHR
ncbi:unnamed protein product [Chrysoparadoxa australica]